MLGKIQGINIDFIASAISAKRIPVKDLCADLLTEKRAARLSRGTGFYSLSIAAPGVCASDMCVSAIRGGEACGHIKKNEIGALIFVTQTPDQTAPATAFFIQQQIGLDNDVVCFDVRLGCSGFSHGLYIAANMLQSMGEKKILLCCGDTISRNAYHGDLSFKSISADAGAVAVISRCENPDYQMYFNINSYGSMYDVITHERGGYRKNKITDTSGTLLDIPDNYGKMNGTKVMDFSIYDVSANIRSLLRYMNISADDVDVAVFHQANKMIVSSLAEKIGIATDKAVFNCENIGNTSCASIPVAISEMYKNGEWERFSHGRVLLSGFGVGMTISSLVLNMEHTKILETLEI